MSRVGRSEGEHRERKAEQGGKNVRVAGTDRGAAGLQPEH